MNNDSHRRLFSHNPLFQLASAFAVGIVFATQLQIGFTYLLIVLVIATVVLVFATYASRMRLGAFSLLTAVFFAAACLTSLELRTPPNQLRNLIEQRIVTADEPVELTGFIKGPVELARDGLHFALKTESLKTATQSLNCAGLVALNAWFRNASDEAGFRELDLQSGSRITVRSKLNRAEQYRNPGVSTLAKYLDAKDIDAMSVIRGPETISRPHESEGRGVAALIFRWRGFLQRQIDSHFSIETAGVLSAALLGNRYNLSIVSAERFREGGTFHILVISGAHISFLGAVILLLARRITVRHWRQVAASAGAVWLYTVAVGADASVVRAALMFTFVVGGHLMFRASSPLNSLGAAALILLIWSPKGLFDPSFQLTFLSVLAIVVLALPILQNLAQIGVWRPTRATPYPPHCSRWLRALSEALYWSENDWRGEQKKLSHSYHLFKTPVAYWLEQHNLQRVSRYLFAAVVVTLAVQLMLLPLQIVYFHRLSLSSLILNVVVGVLLAVLAAVALLALLVAQVSASLAAPFFAFANTIDWLMVHSVDPFSRFGIASVRLPEYSGSWRFIYAVYYLPLLAFAFAIARWKPLRANGSSDRSRGRRQAQEPEWKHENKLVLIVAVQALMFALLVWHPFSVQSTSGKLRLDFLDVGQGDSALLTMPGGATLLIDGGGRPEFLKDKSVSRQRSIGEMVVSEYLWHRGFDSIDYVLATHADADHIDGLNDVVRSFNVRSALVGRTPSKDSAYVQFAETLNARNTPVQSVKAGDVLRFGDVEIDVLWPPPGVSSDAPSRNNDSVVLRIRFGQRRFLLTGDIEKATEEFLGSTEQLRADVVKVPHHGSRTSSTERFVSAVQPQFAVISVGQTSMFGHPHREVVDRWKAIGAEVLTTGRSGMITVTTDGNNLEVTRFVEE